MIRNPRIHVPETGADTQPDDPARWLGRTSLIDTTEPRLRIKAAALTQLARDGRERAMILHDHVKRMPLRMRLRQAQPTARQVLDARRGSATEKATLLIALLRAVGIPARLRYIEVSAALLRGLVPLMSTAYRPLVELWIGERWVRLDTHIFDAAYMAAARERLRGEGEAYGYGIAREGHTMWNGRDDAWVGAVPGALGSVVLGDLGVFEDELAFLESDAYRHRHSRLGRDARWSMHAPFMNRVIEQLRAAGQATAVPTRRART